ncbi:MAG: hypothetical protein HOY79_03640 [Streptomyces sp.]|nr:hypothetical protein [Streptomyces sp.]
MTEPTAAGLLAVITSVLEDYHGEHPATLARRVLAALQRLQAPEAASPAPGDLRKRIAQAIHNAYGQHSLDRAYRATQNVLNLLPATPAIGARTPLICTDERHQAKVAALETALQRVRAVADDMRHTTGARTWADCLDEAINGPSTDTAKD